MPATKPSRKIPQWENSEYNTLSIALALLLPYAAAGYYANVMPLYNRV